jgi:hypothetical protein
MKFFKLLFISLVIVAFPLIPNGPILAQTYNVPTAYQQVSLFIKPEYDRHGLLVWLEGQIVGVKAPSTVKFLVPAGAEMYSAGSIDATGQYSGGPPNRISSDIPEWDEISYEVTSETFRVEYYDAIILGSPNKTISYEFKSVYPISSMQVFIQQPSASTNFVISPVGQVFVDSEGFTEYSYSYPSIKGGAALNFEISYTKSDMRPSLGIPSGSTSKEATSSLPLIIIPIGLGIALIALILIRKRKMISKINRNQPSRSKPILARKGTKSSTGFCGRCGEQVEGSFLFCPYCGAKHFDKIKAKQKQA